MSNTRTEDKATLLPEPLLTSIERYFDAAIRGELTALDAHLHLLDKVHTIEGTSTRLHCHLLKLDGNQLPKSEMLAQFLTNLVLDYALPRKQVDEAFESRGKTGSSEKILALNRKAKELFVDIASNSGEGGEILLFALTERYLKLPQLICKMPLKTSSKVHYHGIDGVHAKIDMGRNVLGVYWGESKLHKDIGDALTDCLDTINEFLNASGVSGTRSSRDIELIRDNASIADPAAQEALLAMLDENHPLYNQVQFRAVCLVGFDFAHYPQGPNQKNLDYVIEAAESALDGWKKKILSRLNNKKRKNLVSFEIEMLLVPFPDVEKFRQSFVELLGFKYGK